MTELIVMRLKGADHRDWMMSRTTLRRAIVTKELALPLLVAIAAIVVVVSPLIVPYLEDIGKKTAGDSLEIDCTRDFHNKSILLKFSLCCFVIDERNL